MKKYAFAFILFLLPLVGHAQTQAACSVTFGNNLSYTNNGVAGFFQLLGAVASAPNTILNTIWFQWSNSSGSGSATITAGIYNSLVGAPTLIAQTNSLVVSSPGWAKLTLNTPVTVTDGGTYFVAGYDSDQSYQFTNGLSGQLCGYTADSYNNTLPSAIIGYQVLGASNAWNMFADFCTPPTPTPTNTPVPVVSILPDQMTRLGTSGPLVAAPVPPYVQLAYLASGDSITAGSAADPLSDSWVNLTEAFIYSLFPGVGLINKGIGGITSSAYDFGFDGILATVAGFGYGPIGYASLFFGMNNFDTPYTSCNACTENANQSQVITAGNYYYTELVDMTTKLLAYNATVGAPGIVPNIIICSCPDPNNQGAGPVDPFVPNGPVTIISAGPTTVIYPSTVSYFRSQALAVVTHFNGLGDNNVQFVDVYNIMYGRSDWFASSVHPNNAGHFAIYSGNNGYSGTAVKLTGG